jgi:hypothetical protein
MCRHLSCLYRLQRDPKQSPRHDCLKLSYRVIDMQSRLNRESQSESRELEVRTFMGTSEIMCGECDGSSGLVRDPPHICVE